ncbi:BREX-1 system adenine-specific DNA-methyltransferase PglX [Vibrio splendidus]
MNTNKLKAYAPKARIAFMEAVKNRAAKLGIFEDRISDITIDGDSAIIEKEVYTRKQGQQRNQLVKRIEALGTHDGKFVHKDGFNQFINETAFTWFNRLTAIRYMEVNEYLGHGFRVLSKAENALFGEGFEILNSAADVADELGLDKDQIIDMVLDGNKEEELYRTLLLGQCHQLSEAMPFMFEKLDDATEFLLPDNLTKTDSILKSLINDLPEHEVEWTNIEIIGWLYQFYISDHKDAVIGKVVKREDIPAATQLFTPNWIVKYLVQNSLGRQWLATYPDSDLKEKMEYYITPAEQRDDIIEQLKAITPTSIDPEEIKVLDPACGSGHILVEVYEVLREIYLERGYRLREIPELILTKNIYGLDIDDRAAQMAAFAVLMKAREDDKRIFSRIIKLNIHSIQSTENLNINQLWIDLDLDGNKQTGSMGDLFTDPQLDLTQPKAENKINLDLLRYLKEQYIDAKNLGSLIEVDNNQFKNLTNFKAKLVEKTQGNEPTSKQAAELLLPIVEQSIVLAIKYDVAVANPPYMGSGGMNPTLKQFAKNNFPRSKSDLFTIFLERCFGFLNENGVNAQITIQNWMFKSAYENFRHNVLENHSIDTLVQIGYNSFPEMNSKVVQCAANVIRKRKFQGFSTKFIDLNQAPHSACKKQIFLEGTNMQVHELDQNLLLEIPGYTIAYWADNNFLKLFKLPQLSSVSQLKTGVISGDNEKNVRLWFEVSKTNIERDASSVTDSKLSEKEWYPLYKGGDRRKWFGNSLEVINYYHNGSLLTQTPGAMLRNKDFYLKKGIHWNRMSMGNFAARISENGHIFEDLSPSCFPTDNNNHEYILGYMNSSVFQYFDRMLNIGLKTELGQVGKVPFEVFPFKDEVKNNVVELIELSKVEWNTLTTSYDFSPFKILNNFETKNCIQDTCNAFCEYIQASYDKISELETRNDHLFLNRMIGDEYDKDLLSKSAPTFLYDSSTSSLRSRYVNTLLFTAISCIMGRYSLDLEGLIYAHSGNKGFNELVDEGTYKTFPADDDGIVPLADEGWVFEDDATARFREFVKTVWGKEHLQENLDFVAESLCLDAIKAKKGESSIDTIRRYFSMQFYKDHLKTYKKRPIYWLFSSGKAKAFECLVYLHRYNEGTLSRMRTEYVTPLMGKLESRKNILEDSKATASGAELRAIDKELKIIDKKQAELVKFDEELKHLAEMKISLDLDDGVKVNYGKFGNLLADVKAIHGKNPEAIR